MSAEEKVIQLEAKKRRRKKSKMKIKAADFWVTALVMSLVIFGVVMIFSASYYSAMSGKEGSPYYYLIRDLIWATLGTGAMLFMAGFDYHWLDRYSYIILGIAILLLFAIYTPLGLTINNATRWLDFKVFTIMPGELAKPACIIFVASYFSRDPSRIRSFTRGILPMIALIGVTAGLIFVQPNTSTAMTLVIIIVGMMFIAGLNLAYLGIGITGGALLAAGYLLSAGEGDYRVKRILSFLDPFADPKGDGYQVIQGLLALGSGGFFGVGIGKSVQKTLYLPEPQNDFILAIIGEELGLVGLLCLLAVYLLLIWRCVHIALNAADRLGMLLASGITLMLSLHVIFNILVVTSLMPPTGIILPFVSWGGNALVIFMACMGIMLNISRQEVKKIDETGN